MGDKGMESGRGEKRRGAREEGQCHVEDVRYMMDTGWAGCFRVDV